MRALRIVPLRPDAPSRAFGDYRGAQAMSMTVESLFKTQAALFDAPDRSKAEARAFRERAMILRALTPEDKRRASIIAAAVLHICR